MPQWPTQETSLCTSRSRRLLTNHPHATLYASDELDSTLPDTDTAAQSLKKRKVGRNARTSSGRTATPAVIVFPKHKRAKFEPKRRQQVANVRKKGACIRCRIKKLPCSGSLPCQSCQRNQYSSRVTFDRWEQCISFSMKDVNIYVMSYPCGEHTYNAVLGTPPFNVAENFCPSFDNMIKWDVSSISVEFVLWMSDDHAQPGSTSLVGILSSSAFESMISQFVGRSLSKHLRVLIELTSILYSGYQASYAGCDSTSLWNLHSLAGTVLLQELESALGNVSLAAASFERLTAFFLVLFATIIAVGYSNLRNPSRALTSTESCSPGPCARVFSEAQKHLLRILAHHMVYIAERINLLEPKISRKRIIEGSACRWNRNATFQWEEMDAPKDAVVHCDLVSPCDIQDTSPLPLEYPARQYHLSRSHTTDTSCRLAGGFGTCVHEQSLNIEPSPMDHILATYPHTITPPQDPQVRLERTSVSTTRVSTQPLPHSTRSHHSNHLPSAATHAAFATLADTDGMCAPFLCTDNNNNDNNACQAHGHSAPTPAPHPQDASSTHNTASTCRSCKLATLPFATLDQDRLCQFCSALPLQDGDVVAPTASLDDPPDQGVFLVHVPFDGVKGQQGNVNLLV